MHFVVGRRIRPTTLLVPSPPSVVIVASITSLTTLTSSIPVMKHAFIVALVLTCVASAVAQLIPASPPIADPSDTRFDAVTEDLTSPDLSHSHLLPVPPIASRVASFASYTLDMARVQWRWGDPIDLYVIKPTGVKKPPVILYLYGHDSETDRFRDPWFGENATRNGFAAVGFVSALTGQRYHDRPLQQWFVSELQESLAVSAHDVQMVLDYLAARGDLDMDRVGMFAQDSGASIAILASAVDPRIKVLDAVDPWGDWPDWLAASPVVPEAERAAYLKPEFLKKVATLDPVIWLPKIQARKFRLQEAMFAPSTPKAAKEKLRKALSTDPGRVTTVIYQTLEETKALITGNNVLAWMQHELQSLAQPMADEKLAKQSR